MKRESLLGRMAGEAHLARREIREGRFQRSMALIAAFAAIVSGFEAYAQHIRGAFSHWLMWTPVALTPPMALAAAAAIASKRAARTLLPFVSLVSLVDGIIGFGFHIRGVQRMPGGFRLGQYNIVMGPPIFAPLLMSIVGILGLLASMLRREARKERELRIADLVSLVSERVLRKRANSPLPSSGPKGLGGIYNLESEIAEGRFQRVMALISASLALLSGGEAYFEHLRGSYNQRIMWTPVLVTPAMVAAAVGAARSERAARTVLPFAAGVTFLDGLLGFMLHLRGLKRMPGGFENLDSNIPMGPPVFAPLLFSAVGLLGFIAVLLRRQESNRLEK